MDDAPQSVLDDVQALARQLIDAPVGCRRGRPGCRCGRPLPSSPAITELTEELRTVLFPEHLGNNTRSASERSVTVGQTLEHLRIGLTEQIHRALCYACSEESQDDCTERAGCAQSIAQRFLTRLPSVRQLLCTDVQAAYDGDPAATSTDEPVLCYPGVVAMTNYRLAHELHVMHVPLIPRMMTEQAHSDTGIDIHPAAVIGEGCFIDHGTGVVIGETCILGKRVRIYQGVTLGAKSFPLDQEGKPVKGVDRHPIVEDDVIIYSGATILGRVVIGRGSIIGGNVWLTHGVPPGSRVTQAEIVQDVFDRGGGI